MGCREVILLDTHVLIWMDIDDSIPGQSARRLISQVWEAGELAVSTILHRATLVTADERLLAWKHAA